MEKELIRMKEVGLGLLNTQLQAIKNATNPKEIKQFETWAYGANAMLREIGLMSSKESLEMFSLIEESAKDRDRGYSND